MRRISFVIALSTLLFASIASAQQAPTTSVPNLIRYSGTLKDASPASTTVGMTFAIYKQQEGGAPIWMETQNVTLGRDGQYSVLLGSTTAAGLPDGLFSQQEERWLGVQLQGQPEQPRVLLVSVPYAFKAHEAETLGGLPASSFVRAPTTEQSSQANSETPQSESLGTKPGFLNGRGATNYVPVWLNPYILGSSAIYQAGGNVGIGTTTPKAKLDVNGGINSATTYDIGGSSILSSPGQGNLFLGVGAGASDVGGQLLQGNTFTGYQAGYSTISTGQSNNVFSGYQAGYSNTTGFANVFSGYQAGYFNTTGSSNTFLGWGAGASNTTGNGNTFSGSEAGVSNTTGNGNTFSGSDAGRFNTTASGNSFFGDSAGIETTTGNFNTFLGSSAGLNNTTGGVNTFSGAGAGQNNATGNNNTFYGGNAGFNNKTGNNDIYIGNEGPNSGTESSTIRIGTQGSGQGQQNAAYIAGIYGSSPSGALPVVVNADGQLGTAAGGATPVNHARQAVDIEQNQPYFFTVTWNFAFSDTNYTATCTPQVSAGFEGAGSGPYQFQVTSIANASLVVEISAIGSGQIIIHCIGIHD